MNTTTSTTDQTSDVVVACCNGHARCPGAGDGFRRRWRMEVDAGLTPIEALSALMAIGNYVSGLTLEEQADRMRPRDGPPDPDVWEQMRAELADYPLLSAALLTMGDPQATPPSTPVSR